MIKLKKSLTAKIVGLLLAATLAFSACGSSDGGSATNTPSEQKSGINPKTENTSDSNGSSSDGSSSDKKEDYSDIALTYAVTSSWDNTNPYLHINILYAMEVYDKIYDTLIYIDENYEPKPRAAESWELEDPTTLVFHLRKDSKWHDGQPVTAKDWVFTLNLVTDPAFVVTKAQLATISGTDATGNRESESLDIEARDDYTLVVHVKQPTYDEDFLLNYGTNYYVLPEHLLKDVKAADLLASDFWKNPIGSGPCRFVSEVAGAEINLVPNDEYYLYGESGPKFGKLIIKVVDPSNAITAMAAGEIDAVGNSISLDEAETIEALYDNINVIVQENAANQFFISANNEKLSTPVRHALDIAIDKQYLVDTVIGGKGKVSNTNVATVSKYHNDDVTFKYDPEEAKRILEEEGFDFSQTLKAAISPGLFEQFAPIIQQQWKEIGVNLQIETVDGTTKFAGVYDGTYDFAFGFTVKSYIPTFYGFNPNSGYKVAPKNPAYQEYTDKIRSEQDESERIRLSKEQQALIAEEVPTIYLFDQYLIDIRSSRSKNITTQGTDQVWNWTADK